MGRVGVEALDVRGQRALGGCGMRALVALVADSLVLWLKFKFYIANSNLQKVWQFKLPTTCPLFF